MALPPLPEGAEVIELPPLPIGAESVQETYFDIPGPPEGPMPKEEPLHPSLSRTLANFFSGGKYNTFQDIAFGGEKPEESFLGKAGQLIHSSGIEGLTGIGKVGQVGSAVSKAGSLMPELPNVSKYVEPVVNAVKKAPSAIFGKTSGVIDPKAIDTAYKIGKLENPELSALLNEGKKIPFMPESRAIYNYARELGLDHDTALLAEHYDKSSKGAWGLWNEAKAQGIKFPSYEDFSKLNLPEQMKLAMQAGVDLGTYSPQKGGAKLAMLAHAPSILSGNFSSIPALIAQSPRIVGNIAHGLGRASAVTGRYVDKGRDSLEKSFNAIKPSIDEYSNQMLGVTGANSKKPKELKKADGGSIPLSLRHVYFHRKARGGSV